MIHEFVDLLAVRREGAAAMDAMARRIFTVWRPLFAHLDGMDPTFHRKKHLEDLGPVRLRALFLRDRQSGRDRGLMIIRIYEHRIKGRTVARVTINAGFDTGIVARSRGHTFLARELWRYRLRHPRRTFYIVDITNSAASYCSYLRTWRGAAPSPTTPTPDERWELIEQCARSWHAEEVPGLPKEARRGGVVVRDAALREGASEQAQAAAAFFQRATGGDPTVGLILSARVGFRELAAATLAVVGRIMAQRGGR